MAYGARLESVLGESPRGFESPILRQRDERPPPAWGPFACVCPAPSADRLHAQSLPFRHLHPASRVHARHPASPTLAAVIFKAVGEGRPYPDHGLVTPKQWAEVAPRQVRLDELVTTKRTLNLDNLLSEDSTFYGDLFAHVVQFRGTLYLEDGLHRAVRAALQQRPVLHARVLVIDD